jgi:hypothetical protein
MSKLILALSLATTGTIPQAYASLLHRRMFRSIKEFAHTCAASIFEMPFGSDSLRLTRVYLPSGEYVVGSRETGQIETLSIEYSKERQAMIWRFQGAEFEIIDDGTLRSFRANTLPPVKVSSRDAIEGLEVRSNSAQRSTYVHVTYNEDERPYFLTFETTGFSFQGWIKRK